MIKHLISLRIQKKYDVYQRGLALMVYNFFDIKSSGGTTKNENISNKELAEELWKPIIRKFKKKTSIFYRQSFIWGADLVDMQIISKFNKFFRFLLHVINIYSKYFWVIPLKDKRGITIINVFLKNLKESNRHEASSKGRKPNKKWKDKGSKNYNR